MALNAGAVGANEHMMALRNWVQRKAAQGDASARRLIETW